MEQFRRYPEKIEKRVVLGELLKRGLTFRFDNGHAMFWYDPRLSTHRCIGIDFSNWKGFQVGSIHIDCSASYSKQEIRVLLEAAHQVDTGQKAGWTDWSAVVTHLETHGKLKTRHTEDHEYRDDDREIIEIDGVPVGLSVDGLGLNGNDELQSLIELVASLRQCDDRLIQLQLL